MKYNTGRWYGPWGNASTSSRPNGYLTCLPLRVDTGFNVVGIGIEVTTAGQAGAVLRLGIYIDSGSAPGALLLDAGTVAADSTGIKTLPISATLTAGWWWLAALPQNCPTTLPVTRACIPGTMLEGTPRYGVSNSGGYSGTAFANGNAGQAGLPNPANAPTVTDTALIVVVQAA
jgi:hypothetical protein